MVCGGKKLALMSQSSPKSNLPHTKLIKRVTVTSVHSQQNAHLDKNLKILIVCLLIQNKKKIPYKNKKKKPTSIDYLLFQWDFSINYS